MTENKGDLISREALKEDFDCVGFNDYDDYNRALRIIDNAPTVTVEPEKAKESELIKAYTKGFDTGVETVKNERPQGEWNYIQAGMAVCPFCGATPHKNYKNFCANCGADLIKAYEEQRPQGEWESVGFAGMKYAWFRCSNCHKTTKIYLDSSNVFCCIADIRKKAIACLFCGADMEQI